MNSRIELRPIKRGSPASILLDGLPLQSPAIELISDQGWNVIFPKVLTDPSWHHEVVAFAKLSREELGSGIRLIDLPENYVAWPGFTSHVRVMPLEGTVDVSLYQREEEWPDASTFGDYVSAAGFVINLRHRMAKVTMSTEGLMVLITPLLEEGIEATCAVLRERFREWQSGIERVTLRRTGSVRVAVDVPESIRVACQQYLLYFLEFLKDLNIEAHGEMSEIAGRILFSVQPTSQMVALERVQEALRVYLSLPQADIVGTGTDIESQRLEATIHHLRSQLAFAAALTRTQQATIEAQQMTITMQKALTGAAPDSEKEELLGGTVVLTRYKGKGFEVNLPKLFRELRDFLRR